MVQTSVTAAPTIAFEGMPQTGGNFPNTIASHPASGSIYYGKAVSLYATSEVTLGEQRVKLPTTGSQGRAEKVCSAQTYNLDPAQTVILDVDNVGGATATFDAAAATITDTTSYAVGDQDTKSFTCTITGGEYDGIVQTILFDITVTTALLVAQQINDKLDGGSAGVVGGQVVITTDNQGSGAAIAVDVTLCDLTFGAAVAGTGDVADINAVTAAEFETVIEADTTATVAVVSGVPTISSPTTGTTSELDFTGGTALAAFGLSVETITAVGGGDLAATNFKGVAIADTSLESTSLSYGVYATTDSVPVMKKGRIWVVSADAVDDISKGVYIRFQNGGTAPTATAGSFRATANADYQLMGSNVRWVASQTIGGVYYGLLELNLDI